MQIDRNLGKVDRTIRSFIALVIGIVYFGHFISGNSGELILTFGIIMLLTSMLGFSPIYMYFKKSTKEKSKPFLS